MITTILAGDDRPFTQLIEPLRRLSIGRINKILNDPMTSEDVFQDACWKAYRGLKGFDGGQASFKVWFARICTNAAITEYRRRAAEARVFAFVDDVPDAMDHRLDTERLAQGHLLSQAIGDAMHRISPALREAFILRELEGKSCREIARITNSNINSIRVRLHRARQALAAHLTAVAA